MATGASTCNLAVILIDARHGVITQTRRHSFICSLLGIKHVIVAINKMDLVGWSEDKYESIKLDFNKAVARLDFVDIHFIPISALKGDNVVDRSSDMPWYEGPTFLNHLENVNISTDRNLIDMRLPVQYVLRPNLDFRGFSGTVASGVVRVGDVISSLPSRQQSRIKAIYGADGEQKEAFSQQAVTVTLEDEIDVSRGNMLVPVNNIPQIGNEFEAMVVWMHEESAKAGKNYLIKHTSSLVPSVLSKIRYKVDVNTMKRDAKDDENVLELDLNEIARCHITLHRPIAFDSYNRNRDTGAFIIVDRLTNITVGAGMIIDRIISKSAVDKKPVSQNIIKSNSLITAEMRSDVIKQKGLTVWLTGLSGSGKSTIAKELERLLIEQKHPCYVLDGDNIRHGLNRDLGFSMEDRKENIRRISEVAALMNDAGLIVITSFISPYLTDRTDAKEIIGNENMIEVYVDTPIDICEQRDPKGLYKKARSGEITQFTGISDPYEAPEIMDIHIQTEKVTAKEAAEEIYLELQKRAIFK